VLFSASKDLNQIVELRLWQHFSKLKEGERVLFFTAMDEQIQDLIGKTHIQFIQLA